MTAPELESQVQGALAYESLFVPALFREWAPRVLEGARVAPGHRVLDVACGTGIVARLAADQVGERGSVFGLDANAGMLAVAAQKSPRVGWKCGTAESLPFEDGCFDAVCCQFGLMFFGDRVAALREMVRVLAEGGHLCIAVWDRLERNPVYATVVAILLRHAGEQAAAALRMPFALGDAAELARLLESAGLRGASITTHRGKARFPSVRVMVEADLRGWLPLVGVSLSEEQIGKIVAAAEQELRRFGAPDGSAGFDTSAHLIEATRPA